MSFSNVKPDPNMTGEFQPTSTSM